MQRRGSLILTQEKARRPVGERRFADPPLAREQPGVMKRARVERAQEQILGRFVPEKRVPQPGMERVGRACLFGSAGLGRFALCHARSAQMGEGVTGSLKTETLPHNLPDLVLNAPRRLRSIDNHAALGLLFGNR